MIKRTELRTLYGIKGSDTTDCCVSFWCPCCAIIQQDKEVIAHSPLPVGQGYQAQPPMQMK